MLLSKRFLLIAAAALCLITTTWARNTAPAVQEGDLIFHASRSAQSLAIQQATGSRYSHMGIILLRDGKPFVFEAASTVKYTPLRVWIDRGQQGHYVVKRLKDAGQRLTPAALTTLHQQAGRFAGKPYDAQFSWSDDRLYCSELVWKIYDRALGVRIGERQKVSEFKLNTPAIRQKLQERYGTRIPWDEQVITPRAMFESPLLMTVSSN